MLGKYVPTASMYFICLEMAFAEAFCDLFRDGGVADCIFPHSSPCTFFGNKISLFLVAFSSSEILSWSSQSFQASGTASWWLSPNYSIPLDVWFISFGPVYVYLIQVVPGPFFFWSHLSSPNSATKHTDLGYLVPELASEDLQEKDGTKYVSLSFVTKLLPTTPLSTEPKFFLAFFLLLCTLIPSHCPSLNLPVLTPVKCLLFKCS